MQLDVESLRAFIEVLDAGGMTRAAERLGISQSAVSWKIKRLEQRIGRELLIRNGRSLRASRDGTELLTYARTIVETHDEAVARLTGAELTGRIRLGATEETSAHSLSPAIGRFTRIHSGLYIEIQVDSSSTLDRRVRAGELDLVLLQVDEEDCRPDDTVIWVDEQRWISSPVWTYADGQVPLVSFGADGFYQPQARRLLEEAGIDSWIAFSGRSTASVIAAVEAGVGVAAISGRSVSGDVIDWPRAESLPDLPPVYQVARLAPGETSTEVAELLVDIVQALGDAGSLADAPVG
ncbi:MAG: LysR family transcriptional regulator [Actinomycetota bacterium]